MKKARSGDPSAPGRAKPGGLGRTWRRQDHEMDGGRQEDSWGPAGSWRERRHLLTVFDFFLLLRKVPPTPCPWSQWPREPSRGRGAAHVQPGGQGGHQPPHLTWPSHPEGAGIPSAHGYR